MKYDTQITITAAGYSRRVQVSIEYEVRLPDASNGSRLDVQILGAHVFTGTWLPWPHFMGLLSDEQRVAIMTQMFEAWCAAKGMPVLEREAAHVARL
jgi:hypothetical protein